MPILRPPPWATSSDPWGMASWLLGRDVGWLAPFHRPSRRKLQLFCWACCDTLRVFERDGFCTTWPTDHIASDNWLIMWCGEVALFDFVSRDYVPEFRPDLLRHVFGDPWEWSPSRPDYPRTVVDLAAELYDGADCRFALHDALLDAGLDSEAVHFRESWHPPGCHVLDRILGKS